MQQRSGRTKAYEHLKTAIMSDPGLVGTFINEQQTAEELGLSRTPIREALLLLSGEQLVRLIPNRGAFVPALTPEQVSDILAARAMIEPWAARETLRRGLAPVEAMRDALDHQRGLGPEVSSAAFIAADREFHTLLIQATGNRVITQLYAALDARHVVIGVAAIERNPASLEVVLSEHQAIVDALASDNEEAAVAAILTHLDETATRLAHH
ncbi:MAG: GntR family transcriptional regulator [Propioniciclava sp.]|uniref:GntR family transcriptional regulator n=1 Tax=Propioniciclava sp. TaxID=2038686 RepID=UPI0039E64A7B